MSNANGTLTDVPNILVGHTQDLIKGITGCTVVLCPPNTVGGVSQLGGAPGTRETDALRPMHLIQHVDAIFLSGGSAYGLAVGDGVMRYLESQGRGVPTPGGVVPIVAGAILFDLDVGDSGTRPDADMGYLASENATAKPVLQGSVGAGTGAKVGGMLGKNHATKGGIGSASINLDNGLWVAAMIAVNAVGDVMDENSEIIAGVRSTPDAKTFVDSMMLLKEQARTPLDLGANTVIGVVATNAKLSKEDTNKLAQMAHAGLTRTIRPAHTPFDGDTIFALSTGTHSASLMAIGAFAAEATAQAIRNAIFHASSLDGIPSYSDLRLS